VPIAEANGIHIYYEIRGKTQDPPLIIIPGLSIDLTVLERIVSQLAQNYSVIAFDNRGAGRSDKPKTPYSIEMMADDTACLLDFLKIGKVHVMGISMGGRIALALALKHPDLVKSLILVSTSARVSNTRGRRLTFFLLEIPRRIGALGTKYPQPNYAYRLQRNASQSYDATSKLHEIQVPTLILQGKKDRLAPYALAEEMHNEIKDSKIVPFDGGHMFFLWRANEFANAVKNFLSSLD
jgi:3-oxoadipate enol-lactonase